MVTLVLVDFLFLLQPSFVGHHTCPTTVVSTLSQDTWDERRPSWVRYEVESESDGFRGLA